MIPLKGEIKMAFFNSKKNNNDNFKSDSFSDGRAMGKGGESADDSFALDPAALDCVAGGAGIQTEFEETDPEKDAVLRAVQQRRSM